MMVLQLLVKSRASSATTIALAKPSNCQERSDATFRFQEYTTTNGLSTTLENRPILQHYIVLKY
jgi:hypothetical protein